MSDSFQPNSSGGLEGYLSSRDEIPAQGYVREGTDNPIIAHDLLTMDPNGVPVAPDALPGVVPIGPAVSPAAPPAQPASTGVSFEEYQEALERAEQHEQAVQAMARQQIELEEAVFEARIAHLDPYDQQQYRNQRYLEQYQQANEAMAERLREVEGSQEEREQSEAKEQVATIRMLNANIPFWDREARSDILSAETSEQMNNRIALWSRHHNSQQQAVAAQQTRAQVAAGAYAGAPQRGAARAQPQVKRGDIEGYLAQKPYVWSE